MIDAKTFEDFVSYWLYYVGEKGLLKKVKKKFSEIESILAKIEKVTISVKGASAELHGPFKKNWEGWAERLAKELDKTNNAIVVFDEFPAMIENFKDNYPNKELKGFIRWFSGMRNKFPGVRYIICGSVCLDFVVRELKVPEAFLDFKRRELKMMNQKQVVELFEMKLKEKGIKPTKKASSRMLKKVDPIPWFVKLLAYELNQMHISTGRRRMDEKDIDSACQNILGYRELCYYEERLQKYSKEHYEVGRKLLYELSRGECISRKELWGLYQYITDGNDEDSFSHLLADLENDFYIKYDDDKGCFRFYSKVLRDWWKNLFKGLK